MPKTISNINVEFSEIELREVLASLAVNRIRLLGRVRRSEKKISDLQKIGGGDKEAYLTRITKSRKARIEHVESLIKRLEEYAKNDSIPQHTGINPGIR